MDTQIILRENMEGRIRNEIFREQKAGIQNVPTVTREMVTMV
jgi:hypothetical protein